MNELNFLPPLLSLIISILMVKTLIPIATRIGLVDHPNERKQHNSSTPLVGGIAILIAIVVSLFFLKFSLYPYRSLFLGAAILVIVGVLDDLKDISPKVRLVVQLLAGFSIVYPGGILLQSFGDIFGLGYNLKLHSLDSCVLTVFATVGMINAMNMLDGQDGLLGGVSLIQIGWLAALCFLSRLYQPFYVLLIICGALMGFLIFNYRWPWLKQAIVFMGDAGSTLLGFICAWFAIFLSQSIHLTHAIRPVAFVWIMAFPLCDITGAMIRRILNKKSPIRPDRGHLHHIIQRLGFNVELSTPMLYLFSFLCGAYGVVGELLGLSDFILFMSFVVLLFFYIVFVTMINMKWSKSALSHKTNSEDSNIV